MKTNFEEGRVEGRVAFTENHEQMYQGVVNEFLTAIKVDGRVTGSRRHVSVEMNHGWQEHRGYFAMPTPHHQPGVGPGSATL
jgi:hypothetical protein